MGQVQDNENESEEDHEENDRNVELGKRKRERTDEVSGVVFPGGILRFPKTAGPDRNRQSQLQFSN